MGGARDLWIFAYGSLMWNPGFPVAERFSARITGFRRAFCVYSVHYRGSHERPGLVLGLARGGTCDGLALRVAARDALGVLRYLRARELIYGVYREVMVEAAIMGAGDTSSVRALTYVADTRHRSYAGDLAIAGQARIIRTARGRSGTNLAYAAATSAELRALAIDQPDLERVFELASVADLAHGLSDRSAIHRRAEARGRAQSARPSQARAIPLTHRHAYAFRCRIGECRMADAETIAAPETGAALDD